MQRSHITLAAMLVLVLAGWLMPVGNAVDSESSDWLVASASAQPLPLQDEPASEDITPDEEGEATGSTLQSLQIFGIIALVVVLPYIAGHWLAHSIRLPELDRKFGITLTALVVSVTTVVTMWPPHFGIDLQGGVILVYEVDVDATKDLLAAEDVDAEGKPNVGTNLQEELRNGTAQLISQLQKRINPSGVSEVVIRPYGENQVEVIVPQAESADLDSLKKLITKAGILEFMIVANKQDHNDLFEMAKRQIGTTFVTTKSGERRARWVRVDGDAIGAVGFNPGMPGMQPNETSIGHLVRGGGQGFPLEVLMKVERSDRRLSGKHLKVATVTRDDRNQPAVSFGMNAEGAGRMQRLTKNNQSDNTIDRKLGIVMDNSLISAPGIKATISDRGIISGSFSQEEVEILSQVLRAGRLPVVLRKEPISEQKISATLGDDTIRKGQIAITISLVAVLIFMAIYYRVAGLIACFALLFNLVLIMAIMIGIQADLTLPGIAGLVLTVGMAVDANVLIFERIREELKSGASLRVALTNGFGKAMSTIVDANITTLITAAVLYRIGTDQVRGFAVTLFVGIVMSMFTAIYVSRGIFDLLERKRILKTLHMLPSASSIGYDFVGKQKIAAIVSIVVIVVGLLATGTRGRDIFDIDFNGGSSVQVQLKDQIQISEVRSKLGKVLPDLSVSTVTVEGFDDRIYKVDTSLTDYGPLGKLTITDRSGKSAEVDLMGATTLDQIEAKINEAEVGVRAALNLDRNGIEFQDTSESESGSMSIKSADESDTANNLRMNFSTEDIRYDTGKIPEGVEVVQDRIARVFTGPNGESLLVMHNMDFEQPESTVPASTMPTTETPEKTEEPETSPTATEEGQPEPEQPAEDMQSSWSPVSSLMAAATFSTFDTLLLQEDPPMSDPADEEEPKAEEPKAEEPKAEEPKAEEPMPGDAKEEMPSEEQPPAEDEPGDRTPPPTNPVDTGLLDPEVGVADQAPVFLTETELKFDERISADTVRSLIHDASDSLRLVRPEIMLLDNEGLQLPPGSRVSQDLWKIKLSLPVDQSEKVLERMSSKLDSTPVWPSSSKIGSKVAGDMQTMAIASIIFCLIGIVGYIWFRFQSVNFGIAAVAALVHDVLVTLGFIALSTYLAPIFGFLQVTEFKISLPVVAAFLTIIGYSLNDTIVIFDRIREVRGKSPKLTSEMINISINQTLGRTLLTSLTTLIVVVILYFIGGEGIHSFSFSLVIGVIAGTYSTVFIACPVLLWLMNRSPEEVEA